MADNVPLDSCDVRDKETLAVYRYFRRQWIEIINGKNEHAIHHQITGLLSVDLEYRTIRRARELSSDAGLQQNGMVHALIDQGFIAHQVLAIRRITEPYDGQKRMATYSLPRVISQIEEHRKLITRENYICVDGTPYDGIEHYSHPGPSHDTFDKLSRTDATSRSRDDLIHPDYLAELRQRLKSSEIIRTYANKVLAHAADPATRKGNEGFDFTDLEKAYMVLAFVTNQISARVLYSAGREFLTHYIFDVLKHIDNPICPSTGMETLQQFWQTHEESLRELERGSSA